MAVAEAELIGRERELEQLEHLFVPDGTRELVLEGEPGIGKTTLWRHGVALARARGFRVVAAQPVEAERELSYAALGDLLAPVLSEIGRLPALQKRSLRVALLLSDTRGAPPEERAVAFALSALLAMLVEDGPLVIAVDDVQWLDAPSATVLAFAVRRLDHPQGRLLVARRVGEPAIDFERARRIAVTALSAPELALLVRQHLDVRFAAPLLEQLHAASGGNPLYAIELARELVRREQPLRPNEPLPIPQDLHALIARRLEDLPSRTRDVLAVAAALGRASAAVVEAYADADVDLDPAVRQGVARRSGDVIEFTHPLYASVLYDKLEAKKRRRIHLRLAELVEGVEERARHLAAATSGRDEAAATIVEQAARAALGRGAPTSALALARRAVELTPLAAPALLDRRLAAAVLEFDAGDSRAAEHELRLLAVQAPVEDRAPVLLELARVVCELHGSDAAASVYRQALESLTQDAPSRVVALVNARLAAALAVHGSDAEQLLRAEAALAVAEAAGDSAVLAECLAIVAQLRAARDGLVQTELLERALAIAPETGMWVKTSPLLICANQYVADGNVDVARPLVERLIASTHARHDPALSDGLTLRAWIEIRIGATRRAIETAEEAHEVARYAGRGDYAGSALAPAAVARSLVGDVVECRAALALLRVHGADLAAANMAEGLLELSLRDFDAARLVHEKGLAAMSIERPSAHRILARAQDVAGLAEALVALGELSEARAVLDSEGQLAKLRSLPRARLWHVRALLLDAEGDFGGALAAFRRALDAYEGFTSNPVHRGRVLLSLGAVQRRRRQKRAAREALEAALAAFNAAGAVIWAQHADAELALVGGRPSSPGALTGTERRVASLVAQGRSNNDVARELHVSPKTVEWNLTKIYRKLHVASRAELAARLAPRETHDR